MFEGYFPYMNIIHNRNNVNTNINVNNINLKIYMNFISNFIKDHNQ